MNCSKSCVFLGAISNSEHRSLFLVVYPKKKPQNTNLKRYTHPSVHSSIIYNSQDMEAT